jgi:N-terminal acetyltransferase B complex non-catalytic subunit
MDLSKSSEGRHSAEELDLYDEGLRVLFPESHSVEGRAICKMRADAVKAAPKDEKLTLACFHACLKRDSLEYAQQASPRNSIIIFT